MPDTHDTHGHAQSIGSDNPLPVDGIAGAHAGTQEAAEAHVDAGEPVSQNLPDADDSKAAPGSDGKLRNTTAANADAGPETIFSRNRSFNGSVIRGGKAVSVFTGCGSIGRR
ncbi:MAG TPA: hypothetical protein VGC21_03990 [Telluria sp.]|jgi:hypothetical protein